MFKKLKSISHNQKIYELGQWEEDEAWWAIKLPTFEVIKVNNVGVREDIENDRAILVFDFDLLWVPTDDDLDEYTTLHQDYLRDEIGDIIVNLMEEGSFNAN